MTTNIITTIADMTAAVLGGLPRPVCNEHVFENYAEYLENNRPTTTELDSQRNNALKPAPLFSICVVCVGQSDSAMDATVFSLLSQTYTNWEICAAFELSKTGLERFNGMERFRLILSDGTANELTKLAESQMRGAYFLRLVPGDRLAPNALYSMAQALLSNRDAEVVYMDEDCVDDNGTRCNPTFKPNYGRDTLRAYSALGRPMLVAKRVHDAVGGFSGTNPTELWEYAVRCTREARDVVHIARIGLSAMLQRDGDAKDLQNSDLPNAMDMCRRMDKLINSGKTVVSCLQGAVSGTCRMRYPKKKQPSVGIVIPNFNSVASLRRCLESIEMQADNDCRRIFIADDGREDEELRRYLSAMKKAKAISVVPMPGELPLPHILNECSRHAVSEVLIFLNGSMEIMTPDFMSQLTELALRKRTGAVGGKIVDAEDNILSVGTVIGLGGWADSPYYGAKDDMEDWLKCTFTQVQRNVSAVSGAFMAIRGELFLRCGLFDETYTGVGWDTELCIRLIRRGLTNCFTPFAKARLYGSLPSYAGACASNLTRCYDAYRQTLLTGDRYYNANYDYACLIPTLATIPYPPMKLNQHAT